MPKHYHTYHESLFVLEGELLEKTTEKLYKVGDTIEHEAYEFHQPEMRGLFMVRWRPPLPQLIVGQFSLQNPVYHIA